MPLPNVNVMYFFFDIMTQQELADRTEVTRQTIIAIEQDKFAPSLELAFRIAEALGCRIEEVFSYRPAKRR